MAQSEEAVSMHFCFGPVSFRLGLPEAMTVMQFDTCATLGSLEHKKRRDSVGSAQSALGGEAVIMALDSSNRVCECE